MSPEQKEKIDATPESELWHILSNTPATDAKALYIREHLAQKSQAATQQKLEELSRRLAQMEQASNRPSYSALTFWLAFLAAVFSSFSVPWSDVAERFEDWRQKASTEWQRSTPRPAPHSRPNQRSDSDAGRPVHEPDLPQNPASSPPSASPLFPQ